MKISNVHMRRLSTVAFIHLAGAKTLFIRNFQVYVTMIGYNVNLKMDGFQLDIWHDNIKE